MDRVTIALDPELGALLRRTAEAAGVGTDEEALGRVAADTLRRGLTSAEPWAATRPAGARRGRASVRVLAGLVLAGATVVIIGGYAGNWRWTGFPVNPQLWNWLQLLALPIAFALFAAWIRDGAMLGRGRRRGLLAVGVGFVVLVTAGYLVPLKWTGFSGNTLWNWLVLMVLPITVVTVQAWPASSRELRTIHRALIAALAVGWIATLVGGYAGDWAWTGYAGNTLWDWLQLLLLPLVVPTVLLPVCTRWASADRDANAAAHSPMRERAEARRAFAGDAQRPTPVVTRVAEPR